MGATEAQQIKSASLKFLTRREHSQLELIQKLTVKGYSLDVIKEVLAELSEQGWQSDERFAESYTRHRIKQGYGPVKISYELRQKGVEHTDLTTEVVDIAGSWQEHIEQVFNKKYRGDTLNTQQQWMRCRRFLQQRGFSAEMIARLLKKVQVMDK